MNRQTLDDLKQQIPLMGYLQAHDWHPARPLSGGRWMGLCPLHEETRPSFYVNAAKNVFYCHGCGQGGDLIRFAQLYFALPFRQTVVHLKQELGVAPATESALLEEAARFYQDQLQRYQEALEYLYQRGLARARTL